MPSRLLFGVRCLSRFLPSLPGRTHRRQAAFARPWADRRRSGSPASSSFRQPCLLAYLYAHWLARRSHLDSAFRPAAARRRLRHRLVALSQLHLSSAIPSASIFSALRLLHRLAVPGARRNQPTAPGVAGAHSDRAEFPTASSPFRTWPRCLRSRSTRRSSSRTSPLKRSAWSGAAASRPLRCFSAALAVANPLRKQPARRSQSQQDESQIPPALRSAHKLLWVLLAHGRGHAIVAPSPVISPPTSPPSRCSGFSR